MPGGKPLWGASTFYGGANAQTSAIQQGYAQLDKTSHSVIGAGGRILTPSDVAGGATTHVGARGANPGTYSTTYESDRPVSLAIFRRREANRYAYLEKSGYNAIMVSYWKLEDMRVSLQHKIDYPEAIDILFQAFEIWAGMLSVGAIGAAYAAGSLAATAAAKQAAQVVSKVALDEIKADADAGKYVQAIAKIKEEQSIYLHRATELYEKFPPRVPIGVYLVTYLSGQEANERVGEKPVYAWKGIDTGTYGLTPPSAIIKYAPGSLKATPLSKVEGEWNGAAAEAALVLGLI